MSDKTPAKRTSHSQRWAAQKEEEERLRREAEEPSRRRREIERLFLDIDECAKLDIEPRPVFLVRWARCFAKLAVIGPAVAPCLDQLIAAAKSEDKEDIRFAAEPYRRGAAGDIRGTTEALENIFRAVDEYDPEWDRFRPQKRGRPLCPVLSWLRGIAQQLPPLVFKELGPAEPEPALNAKPEAAPERPSARLDKTAIAATAPDSSGIPLEWLSASEAANLAGHCGINLLLPQITKLSQREPPAFVARRVGSNRRDVEANSFIRYLRQQPGYNVRGEEEKDSNNHAEGIEGRLEESRRNKARGRTNLD